MLRNRNLRRSLYDHVETLLEAASSYGFSQDFHVYNEKDMRSGISMTRPFAVLVDSAITPTATTLPFIVLEFRPSMAPFELGNRSGLYFQSFLHVFGRNRGERDDIGCLLQRNIGETITIYDYSTGSAVADGTSMEIDPVIDVYDAPPGASELEAEASLLNVTVVSFSGITTT